MRQDFGAGVLGRGFCQLRLGFLQLPTRPADPAERIAISDNVRSGGNLHPARYYKGLLEAAHAQGAVLCGEVEAERIEKTKDAKTGSGWRVLTAKGPIACREVVIATNGYTGDLTPKLKMRASPIFS